MTAALLTAAMPQWSTCNGLVFCSNLLNDRLVCLLDARFRGIDDLSNLVDAALQRSVFEAPLWRLRIGLRQLFCSQLRYVAVANDSTHSNSKSRLYR